MTHTVTIPIDVILEEQFFEDILVTALEGGPNYWVKFIRINHPDGQKPMGMANSMWASSALHKSGSVVFKTDDNETQTLTLGAFHHGVMIWADKHPNEIASAIFVENGKTTLDPSNIDASDADAILQYALFGKLVYG